MLCIKIKTITVIIIIIDIPGRRNQHVQKHGNVEEGKIFIK